MKHAAARFLALVLLLSSVPLSLTFGEQPKPSPNGQATVLDRFTSQEGGANTKEARISPEWTPTDCGCEPVPTSFQLFGLFPFQAITKETPINFAMWSRIEYASVSPDAYGTLPSWNQPNHERMNDLPHRYGRQVDVVISQNTWLTFNHEDPDALDLTSSQITQTLTDNIVNLVSRYEFDGVTIDFDFSRPLGVLKEKNGELQQARAQKLTQELVEETSRDVHQLERRLVHLKHSYLSFIQQLHKALKEKNETYRLHLTLGDYGAVVLEKDGVSTTIPSRLFTKQEMELLAESVDFLLFIPNVKESTGQWGKAMGAVDEAFQDYRYGEDSQIFKKLVIILDANERGADDKEIVGEEFKSIDSNRFGGVGIWAPNQNVEKVVRQKANEIVQREEDYVITFASEVLPKAPCTVVCLHRAFVIPLLAGLAFVYVGGGILSVFLAELRRLYRTYLVYVLAGGVLIILLFLSLVLCVPSLWEGIQTQVVLALLMLLGGYFVKSTVDKKRAANYP
jgi:hypothetical protein